MSDVRSRVLVAAGVAFGIGAAALVLASNRGDAAAAWAVIGPLVGWSFIGTGLYASRRRPESRTGTLMMLLGFAWFLSSLAFANSSLVFTVGSVVAGLWGGVFLQLLLAFPSGRLRPGTDRAIAIAGYLVFTVASAPVLLFATPSDLGCDGCPANALQIRRDPDLASVTFVIVALLHIALLAVVVIRLGRRWSAAREIDRQQLTPVYLCGLGTFVLVTVARAGVGEAFWAAYLFTALLPFAFLAGLLRTHVSYLDAELRAHVEELRASRARLVEAGDAERREPARTLARGRGDRRLLRRLGRAGEHREVRSSELGDRRGPPERRTRDGRDPGRRCRGR